MTLQEKIDHSIPSSTKKKNKTMMNVITLFSGYDSQALALNRLGIPYDLAAWCEIDKNAIKAHDVLFPQFAGRNLGDVSKVDWDAIDKPIDLLTYSSPCQDFSNAGLQRGGEEGSGTRSGLLWEVEKAIDALRPKYLVFENVAALVSDKFLPTFNKWQTRLQGYGYTNFCQVMNAKDYGVPQNRQRIFMVSVRDCERAYYFPKPFKLEKRLKDVLEQNVEERYYLKEDAVRKLTANIDGLEAGQHLLNGDSEGNASTITTGHDRALNITQPKGGHKQMGVLEIAEPQINTLGQLSSSQNSRIIDTEGISPAVINGEKDGKPKIVEPQVLGWSASNEECTKETTTYHPVYVANTVTSQPSAIKRNYVMEPQVLGWTRNEKGEITDRHPVDVANCVTSGKRDNTQNYVVEPEVIQVGNIVHTGNFDNPTRGRIYSAEGVSPCITDGSLGGNLVPKIISPGHGYFKGAVNTETCPTVKCSAMQGQHFVVESSRQEGVEVKMMPNGNIRGYNANTTDKRAISELQIINPENESPTVTTSGVKIIEPSVLVAKRTEYGKAIRKQYGDNNLPESRHNLTALEPKQDGTSNTLTSVVKDNLLVIPQATKEGYAVVPDGGVFDGSYPDSKTRRGRVQENGEVAPTVMAGNDGLMRYENFRIRRLTERELYRLMDVEEKDIDKLLASDIARTQHSKLAGNSIVVACLYYIFKNLFSDTEPEAGTQTKLF